MDPPTNKWGVYRRTYRRYYGEIVADITPRN